MTRYERFLTVVYVLMYAAGIWIVYKDVTDWRKDDPSRHKPLIVAKAKAVR